MAMANILTPKTIVFAEEFGAKEGQKVMDNTFSQEVRLIELFGKITKYPLLNDTKRVLQFITSHK